MSAVWVRVRAEVGARWRAWAGLVVLLGLFGGAVIAIAAGARRTDTAYRRFLADRRAYDVSIPNFQFDPAFANPPLDEVRRLPEVADSVQVKLFEASVNEGEGSVASIDPRFGTSFNGVKVLDGRLPSGPSEAAAPFMLAKAWHPHVWTRITIPFLRAGSNPNSPGAGAIVRLSLRIVGIEAAPGEFPPTLSQQPVLFMSSAFLRDDRQVQWSDGWDVVVTNFPDPGVATFDPAAVHRHPQVARSGRFLYEFSRISQGYPYLAAAPRIAARTQPAVVLRSE